MSDVVITVENLSKSYLVGHQSTEREHYTALRDVIGREVRNFARKTVDVFRGRQIVQGDEVEEFWALKDVSFEVRQGEVLGIIGRNGAGKSTLLKILSRITEPDRGRAILRGRVASLLEVGTGFHPELTGRENIFLNGAILGMTRAEIKRKFDEIVAFAEVEKFLDTPVKRYSSGMYVRLAFAVAAHLEPEILIVDEVLAVGDADFQKKCLGKMQDVVSKQGRTILFVSHNMAAIQTLCRRALLLELGCTRGIDDVNTQIESYLLSSSKSGRAVEPRRLSPTLTLDSLCFIPDTIVSGTSPTFILQLSASERTELKEIAILLCSGQGMRIAILDLRTTILDYSLAPGKPLRLHGRILALPLVEGNYVLGLYVNCADFNGDIYNLADLSVTRPSRKAEFVPYSPRDRGLFELSYEFDLG
jgi:lipopolysaccharide transport system ATP-binding protein